MDVSPYYIRWDKLYGTGSTCITDNVSKANIFEVLAWYHAKHNHSLFMTQLYFEKLSIISIPKESYMYLWYKYLQLVY